MTKAKPKTEDPAKVLARIRAKTRARVRKHRKRVKLSTINAGSKMK